jgi:hypothetical protein
MPTGSTIEYPTNQEVVPGFSDKVKCYAGGCRVIEPNVIIVLANYGWHPPVSAFYDLSARNGEKRNRKPGCLRPQQCREREHTIVGRPVRPSPVVSILRGAPSVKDIYGNDTTTL